MRKPLLLLALVTGCSKGPEADLQYIGEARSAAAEWALVNDQARQGKLTTAYVSSMHEWLRDALQTSLSSMTATKAPYAAEMQALLAEPDDAAPEQLRAHAGKLKAIEDTLESA